MAYTLYQFNPKNNTIHHTYSCPNLRGAIFQGNQITKADYFCLILSADCSTTYIGWPFGVVHKVDLATARKALETRL